jgi:hypothetical protein
MLDKTIADSFPASDPPSTDPAPLADSFAALGKPYRNETTMDILSFAAIQLQCFECGGSYLVPLRDVLLSHKILHDGCPVAAGNRMPSPISVATRVATGD